MNVNKINVSFCNLGFNYEDHEPYYPKLGHKFRIYPFKKLWALQEKMPKDANKGECGMVFPYHYQYMHGIDKMRDQNMLGNGLIFCDLDIHDLGLRDKAWDALVSANLDEIFTMSKTKHGIHAIGLCEPTTADKYHDIAVLYLAFLSSQILNKTGIDLRTIDKAMDTHNTNMGQRFFLCHSPQVWWSENPRVFELHHETKAYLMSEYPMLFEQSKTRPFVNPDLYFESTADVEKIEPDDIPKYIDHTERWCLFDSICASVKTKEEAMTLWLHAARYIPTTRHSRDFYENEPLKNKWWERFQSKPSTYINYELMRSFGLEAKNKQVRCITHHDKENNFIW